MSPADGPTTAVPTPTTSAPTGTGGRPAMPAAPGASGSGRIGVVGPVLAALLLATGLLLLREALVVLGATSGAPWLPAAAEGLRGLGPAWWLVPAGVAVALVGLWLLVSALRPRSRRTLPLTSGTGVFLHTRDVARLASGAAREVDGVLSASATATRRTVSVKVHGTADVREEVTRAVTETLTPLRTTPRVDVRVRTSRDDERNDR